MIKTRALPAILFLWGALGLLFFGPPVRAAEETDTKAAEVKDKVEPTWQIGLAAAYLNGKYGTDSTTEIVYVPLSIRRYFKSGDITLVIPYLNVRSTETVTIVGGGAETTGQRTTRKTNESGLGDIILRARYYLVEERGWIPDIAITGRVKFPTAAESRGLGTGEFDEGAELEFTKRLVGTLAVFADVGYTFIGDPPGVDFRNRWNYDVGLAMYFTKDLAGSILYEEYQSIVSGRPNPRDAVAALQYNARKWLRLTIAGLVGLSDGAADYGAIGNVAFRF